MSYVNLTWECVDLQKHGGLDSEECWNLQSASWALNWAEQKYIAKVKKPGSENFKNMIPLVLRKELWDYVTWSKPSSG